ncbi:MAG: methionyl-tRNA formyltransferase [Cyanobacteriota bacterium]
MRILAFAIPEFGTIFLETMLRSNKNIVGVVLPPVNHNSYIPTKAVAKSFGLPLIEAGKNLKDLRLVEEINNYKPDVILIAAYPRLIPPEIYTIPSLGTINCHPSLLPDYRGANPYFHVIRNGETKTGITFHYLDDTFDTGDIISQWIVPIIPNETLGTLYLRLSFKSCELYLNIVEKLENLKHGERLEASPQPPDTGHYKTSPEIKPNSKEMNINWSESSFSIDCLVRACNPYFGATTIYRGMPTKIWSGIINDKPKYRPSKPPGTIVKVTNSELEVATGSGLYSPLCIQQGMLFITDIKDFIKRNNPKVGEMLN